MDIRFTCPTCGAAIKVDARFAGHTGPCPKCQTAITAPATDGGAPAVEPAAPAQATPQPVPPIAPPIAPSMPPTTAQSTPAPQSRVPSYPLPQGWAPGPAFTDVAPPLPSDVSFTHIVADLPRRGSLGLAGNLGKTLGWFALANTAVVLSLAIISGGHLAAYAPLFIILGALFPFGGLLLSKWLATRAHGICVIDPNAPADDLEADLYDVVASLARRAGLEVVPEVGIYESDDVNAFATGPSRRDALVAFSTALLENLDDRAVAAVAAHEVAHIANGDMLTLTVVQSVVNAVVLLVTLPLRAARVLAFFSDQVSVLAYWLIDIGVWLVTTVLVFLGNLVVLAFSRRREYEADALAARLLDAPAMIHALQALDGQPVTVAPQQKAYAALKIHGAKSWAGLFSTHPSTEERVARLRALAADPLVLN